MLQSFLVVVLTSHSHLCCCSCTFQENKDVKGFVLCSGVPNIFSAGLDIREMYQKDEQQLRAFWSALQVSPHQPLLLTPLPTHTRQTILLCHFPPFPQELWLTLMSTRLAVAAALEGHSPAGGCLLALTADERVMAAAKCTIGLNETRLGIVAPAWFIDSFVAVVGQRRADRMLQRGDMVLPGEALTIGLVDAVAPLDQVRTTAAAALDPYLQVPEGARHMTKLAVRQHIIAGLESKEAREKDMQMFLNLIRRPKIQAGLGKYLEQLSQRAKEMPSKL